MKQFIMFITLSTLTACVTNSGGFKKTAKVEKQLENMTVEQVLADLGKPRYIARMLGSHAKWNYLDQPDGLSGGICIIELYVEKNRVLKAVVTSDGKAKLLFPLESCRNLLARLRNPRHGDTEESPTE